MPGLREKGFGPTSPKALLRLFDAPEGTEPRVTLYRDHGAWCPYCQKCVLYMEEKVCSMIPLIALLRRLTSWSICCLAIQESTSRSRHPLLQRLAS